MPGGDGTGPWGMGPRTGRAAGYCAGYAVAGYMNPMPGRGRGMGRGMGMGHRNRYYATGMPGWQRASYGYPYAPEPTADEEKDMLRQEAETLKRELENIQERISTLEKTRGREE